ncbi:hypothetical protein EYC98_04965 [Halieaceae bacterium IMCC14734]|uniref:Uncharacterized protein n=1 Tax=Candidatus Litorirhabdus singularis TaxID=2518993 RepID=A0ABT3TD39_9GAMM|nr:hypothetical protein [Candidatus Litorirhabdus singularis]MCX2980217.1 hypothetical protein [Candidatus Litorirhabdus singularis]
MKRLLILVLVIAVVAALAWGIVYLEAMREQSAEASRINSSLIIEAAQENEGKEAGQAPR